MKWRRKDSKRKRAETNKTHHKSSKKEAVWYTHTHTNPQINGAKENLIKMETQKKPNTHI